MQSLHKTPTEDIRVKDRDGNVYTYDEIKQEYLDLATSVNKLRPWWTRIQFVYAMGVREEDEEHGIRDQFFWNDENDRRKMFHDFNTEYSRQVRRLEHLYYLYLESRDFDVTRL